MHSFSNIPIKWNKKNRYYTCWWTCTWLNSTKLNSCLQWQVLLNESQIYPNLDCCFFLMVIYDWIWCTHAVLLKHKLIFIGHPMISNSSWNSFKCLWLSALLVLCSHMFTSDVNQIQTFYSWYKCFDNNFGWK